MEGFLQNLKEFYWIFLIVSAVLLVVCILFIIGAVKRNKRHKTISKRLISQHDTEVERLKEELSNNKDITETLNEFYAGFLVENEMLIDENEALKKEINRLTGIDTEPENVSEEEEAKEYVQTSGKGSVKYVVKYDRLKASWVIKREGNERVARRLATKEEAVRVAKELCKKHDAYLSVHKKDGKFQKQK